MPAFLLNQANILMSVYFQLDQLHADFHCLRLNAKDICTLSDYGKNRLNKQIVSKPYFWIQKVQIFFHSNFIIINMWIEHNRMHRNESDCFIYKWKSILRIKLKSDFIRAIHDYLLYTLKASSARRISAIDFQFHEIIHHCFIFQNPS